MILESKIPLDLSVFSFRLSSQLICEFKGDTLEIWTKSGLLIATSGCWEIGVTSEICYMNNMTNSNKIKKKRENTSEMEYSGWSKFIMWTAHLRVQTVGDLWQRSKDTNHFLPPPQPPTMVILRKDHSRPLSFLAFFWNNDIHRLTQVSHERQ